MRHRGLQLLALSTALTFSIGMGQPTMALASTPSEATQPLEMTVQVSEKGFLDQRGKPYGPKNPLTIPKGKVIKITFVFSENMTSLAYGDTHQITILSKKGNWTKESEKIWMFHQTSSATIPAGKKGEQYRGYCIVDCIGMDHLNNLVIQVV